MSNVDVCASIKELIVTRHVSLVSLGPNPATGQTYGDYIAQKTQVSGDIKFFECLLVAILATTALIDALTALETSDLNSVRIDYCIECAGQTLATANAEALVLIETASLELCAARKVDFKINSRRHRVELSICETLAAARILVALVPDAAITASIRSLETAMTTLR